jgi:hypothetical protein
MFCAFAHFPYAAKQKSGVVVAGLHAVLAGFIFPCQHKAFALRLVK